jgi:O-methyltransferase
MNIVNKILKGMRVLHDSGVHGLAAAIWRKLMSRSATNRAVPMTLVPGEYVEVLLGLASSSIRVYGDIIEVGVYKGGTLYRLAAHIAKHHRKEFKYRRLIGVDTFEGHPYINPDKDPSHHYKGRFSDASYEAVCLALKPFPFVRILKGECSEAFSSLNSSQQFCLAHLDVDIYDSCVQSIEYVYPRLSPGGVMIFDEYQGYGQKEFIDRYFEDKPVTMQLRTGRLTGKDYGLIVFKNA